MKMTNNSKSLLGVKGYFLHGTFYQEAVLEPGESKTLKYEDGSEVIFSETAQNKNNNFFVPFDKNLVIGRGSNTFIISRK